MKDVPELWPHGPPRAAWHSFDATPWLHPWMTHSNLRAMREFSASLREEAKEVVERAEQVPNRFAFVGNIANAMYMRAVPIARTGAHIEVFGLNSDHDVFSDPRWEEYDGALPDGQSFLRPDELVLAAVSPRVPFSRFDISSIPRECDLPEYVRPMDYRRWSAFFGHIPAFERLQGYDAILTTQAPYYAYLANKPYAAAPMGGDIWLEASRDDLLGRLQRASFEHANCVLVNNPWIFAHARRFGLKNCLYLPLIIDEQTYSPGHGREREHWEKISGGNFFVFSSARADDYYKASQVGLRGFAEFARKVPGARLVFAAWGTDIDRLRSIASQLGIAERLTFVPLSGKRRLIDYLRSADCLLDQFRVGYFGATGLEAAACGLPVVIRLEHAQYDALCEVSAPPFLNAATSAEVVDALELLARDPDRRHEIAAEHRAWFLNNQSGQLWAKDYYFILAALALGHKFSFDESPLADELSPTEQLYHLEQLEAAPTFPKYEAPAHFARGVEFDQTASLQDSLLFATFSDKIMARLAFLNENSLLLQKQLGRVEDLLSQTATQTGSLEERTARLERHLSRVLSFVPNFLRRKFP